MKRRSLLFVFALCLCPALNAAVDASAGKWRIEPNFPKGFSRIAYGGLGAILQNVTFSASGQTIGDWKRQKGATSALLLRSESAHATLSVDTQGEYLAITSTEPGILLVADASAAPQGRIVARTLDTEGFPVTWQGTSEVKRTYGGTKTQNRSYLPRENSDVMYFSLGATSGPMFHALYDRKNDVAISFGTESQLTHSIDKPGVLQVSIPLGRGASIQIREHYFTAVLGLPFYQPMDDSYFKSAPMVWSSWTSYYEGVNEEDIVRNTDWLAKNLKPYGFQFVQLDDGYDRDSKGQHKWIEDWDKTKFPHGPKWLTDYIKSKGLQAGIWLVPNAYAGATTTHPEWYLRDKKGKLINDYSTPSLDSSNPEVMKQVLHIFSQFDDWGFDYYKLDGEHSLPRYVPAVDHSKLHDQTTDPVTVFRNRMAAIRDTIGPRRFIEECPSGTPLNAIGYVNSYFTGDDLFANWEGMYPLFSSINANAFLNHLAVYLMPGEGLELSEPMTIAEARTKRRPVMIEQLHGRQDPLTGVGTTLSEARTVLSYVALTGVTYPLASVMSEVPEERVKMLKATMPTLPILPSDLFSRGTDMEAGTFKHVTLQNYVHTYPQILDLKVNGALGHYDVTGLTNWTQNKRTVTLPFTEKLGSKPGIEQVIFDFWNGKLLGSFKDSMQLDIDPHDTRVLLVHEQSGHPQVLGTSRHISGSFSLSDVQWNEAQRELSGVSQSVQGDPYRLWVYSPSGENAKSAAFKQPDGKDVQADIKAEGKLLTFSFQGQAQPVRWILNF